MRVHDTPKMIEEMDRIALKYSKNKSPHLKHITRGFDNHVVVVDDSIVIKFPRNTRQNKRDKLEADMLGFLKNLNSPVLLPGYMGAGSTPHHYIYNLMPGEVLSIEEIKDFSEQKQQNLAKDWASFVHWFGKTMPVKKFNNMLKLNRVKPEDNFDQRFKRVLAEFNHSNYPSLTKVAKELYPKLLKLYPNGLNDSDRVIHNDLHPDNLLFVNNKLSAVLDFGDVCQGTVNQELKETTYISQKFMKLVVDQLNKLGETINPDKVLLWSQINKVASIIHRINASEIGLFEYNKKLLTDWFPDKDWSEL